LLRQEGGIPLFVEEITKSVLEAVGEGMTERAGAGVLTPSVAVPASLHASLMARLDRLCAAKEIAQIGAAIGREFPHALLRAVASKPEVALAAALDRLLAAGLLFREGVPPHATYLFKHALVQDAAYGTLLREPRRALHTRIAETLESQLPEIAENQPELLARHCTEAGLIEKAAHLWGKAAQRSVERSALVEAIEQLTRALAQIATLPATPELRREEIKLQVALITPLRHIKGFTAAETEAATKRARLLIEQAEAFGEPLEDPLLLFSVLFGFWIANLAAFDGEVLRELAAQFLALAERQGAPAPLMIGHYMMGSSLAATGDVAPGRAHYDQAFVLYDPAVHRPLVTRFGGADVRVAILSLRSWALWMLGYPDAAFADAERALEDARESGQAATLMLPLMFGGLTKIVRGNYAAANALGEELVALADQKDAPIYEAPGMNMQGCVSALTGKAADAIQMITAGLTANRSRKTSLLEPFLLLSLAFAHAELGQFRDAWRCVDEALTPIEKTKERWCEAEVNRVAGEIALLSPEPDAAKAEAYFERALAIAFAQQAKSWELRAAMSMARLWRDQGKRDKARELLAPVYGWFTEGFDTRDLKEAKVLRDELAS
jgi:predicted ATPase